MKRRFWALMLCAVLLFSMSVQADVDYSELDDMSVEQLESLQAEIAGRISTLKGAQAGEAGLLYLETDAGILSYAGFEINSENFHAPQNNNEMAEALVLKFDYTNKEDSDKSMYSDFNVTVYQNGAELPQAGGWTISETLPPEVDNYFRTVLKGGTIRVAITAIPVDDSPVTILAKTYSSDQSATMELDFRNTPEGDAQSAAPEETTAADEAAPAEEVAADEATPTEEVAADEAAPAEDAAATEDAATSESPGAEEISTLIQGDWMLHSDGGDTLFSFVDNNMSMNIVGGDTAPSSAPYTIDTEAKRIDTEFLLEQMKLTIHLDYEYTDGAVALYSKGVALTRMDVEEDAGQSAAAAAEELEAQISQQPVRVLSAEVTDSYDSRFAVSGSFGLILPHVINESSDDIKDMEINFVGWDSNNLPVTLKSTRFSVPASYSPKLTMGDVNLIPGAKMNENDADTFVMLPFDDTISVAKAKAIVTAYRTFDGTVWINPLLDQWKEVYSGKKLVEPVIYTDTETIQKVQAALNEKGYDCGTPDGIAGSKTYDALNRYQQDNGLPVTNDITDRLLGSLGI